MAQICPRRVRETTPRHPRRSAYAYAWSATPTGVSIAFKSSNECHPFRFRVARDRAGAVLLDFPEGERESAVCDCPERTPVNLVRGLYNTRVLPIRVM